MNSTPGQEGIELLPKHGTTFGIKGLAGFRIEFKKDPAGKVTEAIFYQTDTVIVPEKEALASLPGACKDASGLRARHPQDTCRSHSWRTVPRITNSVGRIR
jgi:hypothetical protein